MNGGAETIITKLEEATCRLGQTMEVEFDAERTSSCLQDRAEAVLALQAFLQGNTEGGPELSQTELNRLLTVQAHGNQIVSQMMARQAMWTQQLAELGRQRAYADRIGSQIK